MTDVSNPPEYASTTLSTDAITLPKKKRGRSVRPRHGFRHQSAAMGGLCYTARVSTVAPT